MFESGTVVQSEVDAKLPPGEAIYLPSPSEIEYACGLIQSTWTNEERRARRRRKPPKLQDVDFDMVESSATAEMERRLAIVRGDVD